MILSDKKKDFDITQVKGKAYSEMKDAHYHPCLLYTSDAADEEDSADLGGRRIIKKKKTETISYTHLQLRNNRAVDV